MFESKLNRGRANGYAPLDSEGKVPLDKTYVGANGSSGTSGTSGVGTNGSSGTSGVGTNGSSGTSGVGTNGSSGTSGSSGESGIYIGNSNSNINLGSLVVGNTTSLVTSSGLSYTIAQHLIVVNSNNNHFHGDVIEYDSVTGDLAIKVTTINGSGQFSYWTTNLDGAAGGNGTSGTSGTSGNTGTSGSSGSAGTSGTTGSSGTSGQTGAAGTSGTSGNGTSGTSGTSGNGTSGSSGATGSSGTSGTSSNGTSGTSFSSPYSGNLNGTSGQAWVSSYGATTAINWNNGNVQTRTLAASETLTFANPNNGATYILIVRQAAAGSYTITWPSVSWSGGSTPTMTATANKYDVYTFVYANSIYYGSYVQNFS